MISAVISVRTTDHIWNRPRLCSRQRVHHTGVVSALEGEKNLSASRV